VRSADWATAINVGLNDVDLGLPQRGSVRYQVRYWRWASFVLGLGAVFGAIGLVLLLTLDVTSYIARHPERMIPGLSAHQGPLRHGRWSCSGVRGHGSSSPYTNLRYAA
jgi:hypothetical protein